MLGLLWLIPMLPMTGFVVLSTAGARMSRRAVSLIGVCPTAVSCILTFLVTTAFVYSRPAGDFYSQSLGTWFKVADLQVGFGLYLDSLSLVMAIVVAFVGLLILLYSVRFMQQDDGFSRFFAYMNLFIASMLILLLADNFLLMYLGWEGVGLCSYLLIGFWHKDPANGRAAIKAFVVTRIGDTLMMIGLLVLVTKYSTLEIQPIMNEILRLPQGSVFCTLVALFLLGGALGKSAQLPLQTWLPDAMAGPSPVSALIHAATMVTAGVYLIARTHVLFSMAPVAMQLVAGIGAATLLVANLSALVQKDIKRILAYSTIGQIGYMFMALGCGAWTAAIYHFVTHALFKSSLFLGAGILIVALKGEHNIFKMGGLRKELPATFWAFLGGALTLVGISPLTVTIESKDLILNAVWESSSASKVLWLGGVLGSFLTAAYAFRLLYLVFWGDMKTKPVIKPPALMVLPFSILAFLAAISGIPEVMNRFFGIRAFYEFLQTAMPQPVVNTPLPADESVMQIFYVFVSLAGIGLTYAVYRHGNYLLNTVMNTFIGSNLHRFIQAGFGFDWLYDWTIVRPYIWMARINKDDVLDRISTASVSVFRLSSLLLSETVTGNVRWYVAGVGIGTVILLGIAILL